MESSSPKVDSCARLNRPPCLQRQQHSFSLPACQCQVVVYPRLVGAEGCCRDGLVGWYILTVLLAVRYRSCARCSTRSKPSANDCRASCAMAGARRRVRRCRTGRCSLLSALLDDYVAVHALFALHSSVTRNSQRPGFCHFVAGRILEQALFSGQSAADGIGKRSDPVRAESRRRSRPTFTPPCGPSGRARP